MRIPGALRVVEQAAYRFLFTSYFGSGFAAEIQEVMVGIGMAQCEHNAAHSAEAETAKRPTAWIGGHFVMRFNIGGHICGQIGFGVTASAIDAFGIAHG